MRIRLLRRKEYYLGFAYLSVCNVHQLVVPYTKHGFFVRVLHAAASSSSPPPPSSSSSSCQGLRCMTLTDNILRRPTTADRPVANRLHRARAVSTFVHGFSVRHRNVQAVQVRRRLNPSVCRRYYTHRLFWGLIKTCILPTASALMGFVPTLKLTPIISVNNTVLKTRCVLFP